MKGKIMFEADGTRHPTLDGMILKFGSGNVIGEFGFRFDPRDES